MRTIRHYAAVFSEFFRICVAQALSFRINFVLLLLADVAFYITTLLTAYFLFDHVPMIGGWNRTQFMFFLGFALAVEHLHMLLIGDAFWSFSDSLRTGQLDFHLLRPIGSIFSVFFSRPRPGAVFDFVIPWSVLIWFGFELALPWYAWMLLPIFALLGIMLRALIELTLAMGMFWIIDGTPINFLRIHLQSISRWPDFAYVPTVRRFFIGILPVLLISSAPVHFLLEGHIWPLLPAMAVAFVVCFFLIRVLWRLGLRRYESASS